MDHLAILKKEWNFDSKMLNREKTTESRWLKIKRAPWGRVNQGDTIYFKNSGENVKLRAEVSGVEQHKNLTPEKVRTLLRVNCRDIGIEKKNLEKFSNMFENKKYCVLIRIRNVSRVEPFSIDKTGYGARASWITLENIEKIKK